MTDRSQPWYNQINTTLTKEIYEGAVQGYTKFITHGISGSKIGFKIHLRYRWGGGILTGHHADIVQSYTAIV